MANEPGNVLTPRVFVERGAALAAGTSLDVQIHDERAIEALGMGLIEGVARGSIEPARLLTLSHTPPGVTGGPVLGLVGKGVTFDTGGISIKPADMMDRMKDDMAGGAAVITAMRALSLLEAPIRVVGVVPAVENMPGGKALKPGDVIRGASGKTVEVLNTDAEGRLILGDALWYAREKMGATHLVDVATLTGACVVALGRITSALFGTPQWWVDIVRETGRAGRGSAVADAALRGIPGPAEERDRRHGQRRRPPGRRDHRRAVPEGVHRRAAVGPPRRRRHRVGRRAEALLAEGRHRRRGAHAGGAGVHGVPLGGSDSLSCVASGSSAVSRRASARRRRMNRPPNSRPAISASTRQRADQADGSDEDVGRADFPRRRRRRQLHDRRHRLKQREHPRIVRSLRRSASDV